MNSFSSSSVQFLESATTSFYIIGGVAVVAAIALFTVRFYLSAEDTERKKQTWIKKVSTAVGTYLLISIFVGSGIGKSAFEYFTQDQGSGDSKKYGTNSGIDTSNSFDISGSQYELDIKSAIKHYDSPSDLGADWVQKSNESIPGAPKSNASDEIPGTIQNEWQSEFAKQLRDANDNPTILDELKALGAPEDIQTAVDAPSDIQQKWIDQKMNERWETQKSIYKSSDEAPSDWSQYISKTTQNQIDSLDKRTKFIN